MFFSPGEFIVGSKDELIDQLKKSRPGDIIRLRYTSFSITLGDTMHDPYLTCYKKKSKRYNTNIDRLIYIIKKSPNKIWNP